MRFIKQILFLLGSALAATCFIASASAQVLPSVTVQTFSPNVVYQRDFDVQVLDFTIQTVGADTLETITVAKNGTARENIDYMNLKLWADEGQSGFQGWGIDKQVGTASFVDNNWVVSNIHYPFQSSQRFFVSVETGTLVGNKIAQFALQPATDNGDGVWQGSEHGVFLGSKVVAYVPESAYSATIKFDDSKADALGPKGYISSLPAKATVSPLLMIEPAQPILIQGEAKDRNGGSVVSVTLSINGVSIPVTNTGTAFSTWSASYLPTMSVEHLTLQLTLSDGSHLTQIPAYYIDIDSRHPSFEATTIAVSDNSIVADGTASSRITVILSDDSFMTLPGRELTFKTLRSQDFLSAETQMTDDYGKAVVYLTSKEAGTAVVQVYAGSDIVGGVAILVQPSAVKPQPEPQPTPDAGLPRAGDLIKGSLSAVYYYDGSMRHVFVSEAVYKTWYGSDFSTVKQVSDTVLASIKLGKPVGFRPGTLIKTPSVPAVYVVDRHQTLRHVTSEQVAGQIFGNQWNKQIYDLSEALLFTYNFGSDIITTLDYNQQQVIGQPLTISDEL